METGGMRGWDTSIEKIKLSIGGNECPESILTSIRKFKFSPIEVSRRNNYYRKRRPLIISERTDPEAKHTDWRWRRSVILKKHLQRKCTFMNKYTFWNYCLKAKRPLTMHKNWFKAPKEMLSKFNILMNITVRCRTALYASE